MPSRCLTGAFGLTQSSFIHMNRALLIRIAAALSLMTCLGHTVGTFMTVPPEQDAMHATIAIMKTTMVPMPVGAARSYMQILDGNNICTSLFLLLCAVLLFAISGLPSTPATNRVILITALALVGFAVISVMYFFPVPTVLTGFAAVLSIVACSRPHVSLQSRSLEAEPGAAAGGGA